MSGTPRTAATAFWNGTESEEVVAKPSAARDTEISHAVLQRIHGEFLEMPGLRLTCRQAQRLWGLDEATCHELLEFLVEEKFLSRPGPGSYARVTDGYAECPRPRMAKATIDHIDSQRSAKPL
jgi:hypothetical protein